ncbi:hypothetical protein JW921_02410 [Candidatus Fermentibacterales bacterium]|nr:hypothetical protein [Candidatus Fermentibacterales bacterium]
MTFCVNDLVVHPIHGAGRVRQIAHTEVSGESTECVVVDLVVGNAGVLLPVENLEFTGLRHVVDRKTLDSALEVLTQKAEPLPRDWRRRIETLRELVHSGDPGLVAQAVRDIHARSSENKMNPSEKRVLAEAIGVLAGEVSLVKGIDVADASEMILSMASCC